MKDLLCIVLAVFLSCSFSSCKGKSDEGRMGVLEGGKKDWGDAPDFTLSDLNGNSLTLSNFRGKVIILNFWSTQCPPCRREIPDFIQLYNEYQEKGLVILGVNLDIGEEDAVRVFSEEKKINYPIVFGNADVTRDYGGIWAIPTTFIIDKFGNIRKRYVGYQSRDTLEKEINELF